jgi:hypothetical protein
VLEKRLVPDPNGPTPSRHASYFLSRNDQARVQDIFWDMLIEGVVRPGLGDGTNCDLPHFHVTDRGRAALSAASPPPYDPDGYLKRLQADLPAIDPVIVTYLKESLHAFRIGCLLSSTVTLGWQLARQDADRLGQRVGGVHGHLLDHGGLTGVGGGHQQFGDAALGRGHGHRRHGRTARELPGRGKATHGA